MAVVTGSRPTNGEAVNVPSLMERTWRQVVVEPARITIPPHRGAINNAHQRIGAALALA